MISSVEIAMRFNPSENRELYEKLDDIQRMIDERDRLSWPESGGLGWVVPEEYHALKKKILAAESEILESGLAEYRDIAQFTRGGSRRGPSLG